eukprot:jgi/Galph1/5317/GphlegSOOS_G3909.1
MERYDRQIRFWGEHGQAALKNCSVYLLGASATGTETLKNLILPGVGSFTIVDVEDCSSRDLGRNFFVDENAVNCHKKRAQVCEQLLQELNEEVRGSSSLIEIEQFLNDLSIQDSVTPIFIFCLREQRNLLKASQFCWERNIPFVYAISYGLLGFVRVVVPEHCVFESKDEMTSHDLRLSEPFEELETYVNNFPLESLDDMNHALVPYAVLLVKALQAFKELHYGSIPESKQDQEEIRSLLKSWRRSSTEENFTEALQHCHFIWMQSCGAPKESIRRILEDRKTNIDSIQEMIHRKDHNLIFWIFVAAVRRFVEKKGKLPLKGSVPDMVSDTESYIGLQRVYKKRAEKEQKLVFGYVKEIAHQVGLQENSFTELQVADFCRNVSSIEVIRYCSLQEEFENAAWLKHELQCYLDNGEYDVYLYMAWRITLEFWNRWRRFPGEVLKIKGESYILDTNYENDYIELERIAEERFPLWTKDLKNYLKEMCRYGASELHSVASLVGGVAAQEVVKLVTKQFRPVNGWFIFNAANATSMTLSLCQKLSP